MAILKNSENTTIVVRNEYVLKADVIGQTASKVNIESKKNNLTLICGKKVVMRGNKK